MMNIKEIAAGIDISKSKLDVCIKNHGGTVATADFSNDMIGGKLTLEFFVKHGCFEVAMESTGPYWETVSEPGIRMRFAVQDLIFR